ncbi:Tn3 family transposase [Streptomyces avermitilis]|uniref:Tn3 family transposase n=1 Tax=Streptomyces avermitilis TaxID=33903 RepID=UPI0033B5E65C
MAWQLNKGENLHALRRELLASAGEGAVRRRHHAQQSEQMWCLTATDAIATWTTEYSGLAVTAL